MEDNSTFNKALSNFTQDFASGDAIRHLTDLGYSIPEIRNKLDYPTPIEKIKEIVWNHLVSKGIIVLEDPRTISNVRTTYVKEYDSLGKSSFRRIEEKIDLSGISYVSCDFGKRIYKNRQKFEKSLEVLDRLDTEYVQSLKWPLQTVYHICDERMARIANKLGLEIIENVDYKTSRGK